MESAILLIMLATGWASGGVALIVVLERLRQVKHQLNEIEVGVARIRTTQIEAEARRTTALEVAQLPAPMQHEETRLSLLGKQVYAHASVHTEKKER